ncbi:rod shape-determining protein RodA [Fusobacterium necrophorum]|uniref:rod shape-determining protein RodA n=1 Tax=Fusobacterium necrophorum TaxID=859 RepID=UPI001013A5C6|nr:rod shape-determining protein RodA [Fusobacterium necrophorum]RXZ29309.1 rod shape-determining protein RodA [Fusobacterium necrophorum]
MGKNRKRYFLIKRLKKMNLWLIANILAIFALSLMSIYSSTIPKGPSFFQKELLWFFVSAIVFVAFSLLDYHKYMKYDRYVYLFNVLMLLSVFVIGTRRLGAQRWIDLGPISIQPSEFAKIFLVLTLSSYMAKHSNERFEGFRSMMLSFLHMLPIFILIALQPDLGTSLVLLVIYASLVFINGLDWRTIFILLLAAISAIPGAYFFLLHDYQRQRVLTFLHPGEDMLGSGWNVMQSMIAIGSGGVRGKGFLENSQSKLRFLPESHTDFIGAVYLEERGFLGGVALLLLYLLLLIQILKIAEDTEERFGKLICYGIASIFFFHIFINLGMIMGIMPVTGLPLLLMSYGGSSLVFAYMMLGIVQSVKFYRG